MPSINEKIEIGKSRIIQEGKKLALINFGARLLTGRGRALDVLGQAVQQTLPEFTAARRATRKEEAAISTAEKQVEAQRSAYALTKEQEDAVARANIMSQAMFSNLGFFQELAKSKNANQLNLDSTFKLVTDKETNLNTEITLSQYSLRIALFLKYYVLL